MEKEEFKKYTLDYLVKKYPEVGVTAKEGFELETKKGITMFLEGAYAEARQNNFEKIEEILDKQIRVFESIESQDFEWEDIKNSVFPQIKLASQLKMNIPSTVEIKDEIVSVEFFGELRCAFVIDRNESFSYISQKTLADLKVNLEELKPTAINNLMRLENDTKKIEKIKDPNGHIFMFCETNDGYAAARILLPDFYERMVGELGNTFLVAIPERDFMVAGTVPSGEIIEKVMVEKYEKSGHPVCPVLLLRDPSGWKTVQLRKDPIKEN